MNWKDIERLVSFFSFNRVIYDIQFELFKLTNVQCTEYGYFWGKRVEGDEKNTNPVGSEEVTDTERENIETCAFDTIKV